MLGTILIFVLAARAGVFFAQSSLLDRAKETPKDELLTAKDKATIMIMGVDERSDDVGRSDTLMVATIDPQKNEASLLSIPRDTRVAIPKNGYDKINAAYAYGGEKLTQRTVEDFLGIRMDHYVIINTHAFQKIIDAIGGIDIDVEKRMYYEDPWDDDGGLVIDLRPGRQHMDGKTAVTYVRYRDEEGDIGRVKRQQKFMRACVDAVTTPTILPRLPGIIASVIDSVKTDLSVRQMLPGRPLYIDEVSYWIPDMEQLRRNMVNTLGLSLNANERSRMERAIRDYENSIPAGATEVPEGDNSIGRRVSGDEALDTRSRKHSSSDDSSKTERKSTDQKSSDKSSKTQSTDTSPPKKSADTDSGSGSGSNSRHASTRQSSSADSGGDTAAPQRSGGSPGKEN